MREEPIDRRKFNGARRKPDSEPPKRRDPERVAAMRKMRAEGAKLREIAEAFGISTTAVWYNLSDAARIQRRHYQRAVKALEKITDQPSLQNPRSSGK